MSTDWTILLFSLCLLDGVISCDPDPNSVWKEYKPIERMLMSQIVVYGKDLNNVDELTSSVVARANVSVFAILKKKPETEIPATIKIRLSIDTCSGTTIPVPGKEYLFMIRHDGTGEADVFDLDEVNLNQTAIVEADETLLYETVKTCSLNDVRQPDGLQPPVDPELQAQKIQSIASHAANNETCKMVKVIPSGETETNGNGANGLQPYGDLLHQAAIALLNFLTVAIFTLLI